jgi:phospholipid/cholesterol/gamma-HCH transport system substrate-binding protein
MKSFRDRNPYAVGIVSVLVIGAFTGLAFGVGLLHLLERTYSLKAEFRDAAGLRGGDPVEVAGIKVGRVTDVAADRQRGLIIVEMVVNQGVEVHDGAHAEVALLTLLGAKYIRLTDVMSDGPILEKLPHSDGRRTIPVDRTKTPFDVFELTRVATEGVQSLDTKELNSLINSLADVTQDKKQSVTDLIDGLDKVSTAINQRDAELRSLLDRADTLSKTLADKDQTLVALIDQSKKILDLLVSRRNELAQTLGSSADVVTQLSQLIGDHQEQLDSILSTLHPTLDVVAANQQHIDNALAWLGPGFYNQSLAGTHGPFLDIFINSLGLHPKQLLCDIFGINPCLP